MNKRNVVLKLARLSIPQKIEKARFIVMSMTGNANFTTPNPPLAAITANINNLEAAHLAAEGGGSDDTANMHAKELLLDLSLKLLGAYVESTANASPVNAEAIILSSGMGVKGASVRTAREFNVSVTGRPGEVKMSTVFVKRGTFIWQVTTDPSSEGNWQTFVQGTRSKLVKNSLTSGTRYYFRVAVVDKNGQGPWSNVLDIIAL